MLALKERTNFKYTNTWSNTYGSPIKKEELYEKFSEILDIKNNSIIIPSPFELGIEGKDIISDLVNFFENLNISNYFSENELLEYDGNQKKFVLTKKKINPQQCGK